MKKFNYFLIPLIVIVLILVVVKSSFFGINIFSSLQKENENYNRKLTIGEKEILVEFADSQVKSIKGLSGRESLEDGKGMLFIYPNPQIATFWMPDMNFPIDIVFINNGKIVEILGSVPNYPKDYPRKNLPLYISKEEVNMVLEVPAGWCSKNEIMIGDNIELI